MEKSVPDEDPPVSETQEEETQAYAVLAKRFGSPATYIKKVLERHFAPNVVTESRAASNAQEQEVETGGKWTVQEIRNHFLSDTEAPIRRYDGGKRAGIPAEVDALDWYRACEKMKKGEMPAPTKKKEDPQGYYAEVLYEIYRSSGYSIEDSIHIKYTPHGQEIMRYLAKTARVEAGRCEQDAVNDCCQEPLE